jgi:hypothetical protein
MGSANRLVGNPWSPEIPANIARYPFDEIFRLVMDDVQEAIREDDGA